MNTTSEEKRLMRIRKFVSLAVIVALTACSGGGGGSSPAVPSAVVPSNAGSSARAASGTLSIALNTASSTPSSMKRPAYVSVGTAFATLFIDGATTGQRQSCNAAIPCTFNWTSTSGQHTFAIEADSSASIAGGGAILSEGQQTYTLNVGNNALGTLTLEGVPGQIIFENENLQTAGCPAAALGACYVGQYGIADAAGDIVKPPGNFTQPPVPNPISPPATGAITVFGVPNAPDANGTDYGFSLSCTATGDYPVTMEAAVYASTFNISPYISTAQITAYNLQTPELNAVNWPSYLCQNGTVTAIGPANGSVNVQGKKL